MLYPARGDLLFPHYLVSSSNGVCTITCIFLHQLQQIRNDKNNFLMQFFRETTLSRDVTFQDYKLQAPLFSAHSIPSIQNNCCPKVMPLIEPFHREPIICFVAQLSNLLSALGLSAKALCSSPSLEFLKYVK